MAIRIGQSPATSFSAVLPPTSGGQNEGPSTADIGLDPIMDDETSPEGSMGGGQVDPEVARYMEPNYRCNNCVHFMEPGSCEIVAGPIDPEAVCSLHTPDAEAMAPEAEEMPNDAEGQLLAAGPAVEETEEDAS